MGYDATAWFAGVTLLAQRGGGLYRLLPATIAGLVGGVVSAWLFLVSLKGEDLRT